jgi:hypothetical protein
MLAVRRENRLKSRRTGWQESLQRRAGAFTRGLQRVLTENAER